MHLRAFSRLHLSNKGAGSGALISPVGGEVTDTAVVSGETVDPGLDENEAELGVHILSVALEVLSDGNSLLEGEGQLVMFRDTKRGSDWLRQTFLIKL